MPVRPEVELVSRARLSHGCGERLARETKVEPGRAEVEPGRAEIEPGRAKVEPGRVK